MALRLTLHGLLSSTILGGPKRLTAHYLMSTIPFAAQKRISSHDLVTSAAFQGAKRVTGHYIQSTISIHNYFELIRLESTSELHDFLGGIGGDHGDISYVLAAGPIPEHNPYRPRIPEQLVKFGDDFYDFYEENQNIHRQQHNLTQMGDTTFPYQLFLQTHTDKQFTLGSVGRFFHEDFGLIKARYVQFDEMASVSFAQSPVGLFERNDKLEWKVTNDLTLSHPDLVIGISAAFATPVNKTYGWVIVDGPSLQQVKNDSTTAAIGESFAWNETGSVSNAAKGKVIGRRVNRVHEAVQLLPGQLWIRTESFSEYQIRDIIDDQTAAIQAAIDALETALSGLGDAATLSEAVNTLRIQLMHETNARKQADANIQAQLNGLNFVTQGQLNAAVANAAAQLVTTAANLQAQIDAIRAIALEALAKANSIPDWSFLTDQISTILTLISTINAKPKGRFPIVDGSVPPNLAYLDDGSLVYVETF